MFKKTSLFILLTVVLLSSACSLLPTGTDEPESWVEGAFTCFINDSGVKECYRTCGPNDWC